MSETRLAGKRVIVTGAGQGLGRAFALHLAGLGARLLAADIRGDRLETTREHATARGVEIHASTTDVTDPDQTHTLAATATEMLGGLDALVNNAAIVEGLAPPVRRDRRGEWDRVLEVNVKGEWLCAKAAVPLLRDAGGGSIVNMASEVAFSGSPGLAHYVTSKAAVIGLTRVLTRELGPDRIRVNALAPGFIPTEGSVTMTAGAEYDVSATPLGRLGQPADVLGALAFLISDESAFVTGQTLLVNGGRLSH